jgi:c-di-GMP-related signal transduction protein
MSAMRADVLTTDLLGEVLVARQPILDRHLMVVGQELLYRDVAGNAPVDEVEGLRATATILIEGVMGLGRELVGEGELAHVNVPVSLLLDGSLLDLPADNIVLELHADVVDSSEVRFAIAEHRTVGFRVALDAITPGDPRLSLAEEVDFVKVDVAGSGHDAALELIGRLRLRDVLVIAEKVEEPAAFDDVVAAGAWYVQGFFFTRPRAVRGRRPVGLSTLHFQLLQACTREEIDLDELERLIRSDLTLADRFLTMIASAAHRWGPVASVRDGMIALGQRALQRWVRLLIMSTIVRDDHPELLMLASVRARYCETLERRLGTGRGLEAFAAGMFSILGPEGVLSSETLAALPISGEVRSALAGEPCFLRSLLDIQLAAERADWSTLVNLGHDVGLSSTELAAAHVDALTWGNTMVAAAVTP